MKKHTPSLAPNHAAQKPQIHPSAVVLPGAVVTGNVTVGSQSSVFYHSVLRGDVGPITIGSRSNIQDGCVLHTEVDVPLVVGDDVTVGHSCVLHSCTIQDGALVGMGSIVLDGAVLEKGCLVGAGSLVTGGTVIPQGMLAFGRPARVVRPLTEEEKQHNLHNAQLYVQLAGQQRPGE